MYIYVCVLNLAAFKQDGDASQIVEFPFIRTNSLADALKLNYFCSADLLTNM
jgi:hypothetical protein